MGRAETRTPGQRCVALRTGRAAMLGPASVGRGAATAWLRAFVLPRSGVRLHGRVDVGGGRGVGAGAAANVRGERDRDGRHHTAHVLPFSLRPRASLSRHVPRLGEGAQRATPCPRRARESASSARRRAGSCAKTQRNPARRAEDTPRRQRGDYAT